MGHGAALVAEEIGKDKTLVVAYVILQDGQFVSADKLHAFGKHHLAAYQTPRIISIAKDFPTEQRTERV